MPDPASTAARARRRARRGLGRVARRLGVQRVPAPGDQPPAPLVRTGMVERFAPPWVEGWIAVPKGAPPVAVSLRVNGTDVASTWAADPAKRRRVPGSEVRRFRFVVKSLMRYVGPADRLKVVVDGRPLPIAGHGTNFRPTEKARFTLADLQAKFDSGYVFSRSGVLQLSKALDHAWQRRVLAQADQVRRFVAERHDLEAFFIYGTLLGAIREGGFIGHDSDLDLAYVSRHTDGADAATELRDLAFDLIDAGWQVRSFPTHLRIASTIEDTDDVSVDLFHLWFDESGVLRFPYGMAGVGQVERAEWQGVREIEFAGGTGLLPVCAEKVAEVLYGSGWRQPQPGFSWNRDRTARGTAALLPDSMVQEVYWADFYAHAEFDSGSRFFDFVSARDDLPATVVDLGCGDGRDAIAHAVAGRRVFGVDRSHVAVRHAQAKAEQLGLVDRLTFVAADVSDATALAGVLAKARAEAGGGAVLIYLRFFLHSITEETQRVLLDGVHAQAEPGDVLAAEFRTEQDKDIEKVYTKHYRRFQNGPAFGRELQERYGYELLEEVEGRGLSPYKDEDPHLYRVVARRR